MACKDSRDDLIGEKLLIDMVTGKVKNVIFKLRAALPTLPALPKSPIISNSQDQMLVQQLTEIIKVYGDNIDQDETFNDMIDDLAKVADVSSFSILVEKVFTDGQITWGRIIVLFYLVGKLSAKMVLIHTHRVVSSILNASLDYFRKHLLEWICKMGGWNGSIPALACFSIGISLKDQVERAGICASSLPEAQPMSAEEDQILEQIVYLVKAIGEAVDRDAQCNNLVTKFAPVANLQSFRNLAEKVFNDGITWGKIATLICIIGKTIAKIIDNLVPNIVSWTLDYFKDKLLNWIHSRGGWINSISSLACYPLERDFASSSSLTSLSSGVIFISGVLLGGLIVWRLKKGA